MEWTDEGILLSVRPHGETAAIAVVLTQAHGCHAGLVPGGQGHRAQAVLQPGNKVQVRWRARLLEHLGNYNLDVLAPYSAPWLDDSEVLNIIASACAITEASLPERQPMPGVYAGLEALFSLEDRMLWGASYVQWEVGLLRALGYGLDFSRCALTGETEGLAFVSPRTGRAVTQAAATPYKEKLLPLPSFLVGGGDIDAKALVEGLALTGHFLSRHVFSHPHSRFLIPNDGDLPLQRSRLAAFYERQLEDK